MSGVPAWVGLGSTPVSLCTCSLYIISYGLCMHFSAAPQALFSCCATSQVVPSWVLGHI